MIWYTIFIIIFLFGILYISNNKKNSSELVTVSYTHLTLPTNSLV